MADWVDAPALHTMYVDKPMRGHNLMLAIASVNRVFNDKTGGLVLDYIGIPNELRRALRDFTQVKGKGKPALKAEDALPTLEEKMHVLQAMMHGFDYRHFRTRVFELLPAAANHILGLEDASSGLPTTGERLGLQTDEMAFYDALADNESAVRELGDETLRKIAVELTERLRKSVTVDWAVRENVRARIRVMVRTLLRRYKYPPDRQESATELVLEQAARVSQEWVA